MGLNNLNIRTQLLIIGLINLGILCFLPIDNITQLYIFGIIILLTGVPHGALDLFLDKQRRKNEGLKFSKPIFLLIYATKMVVYGIFWYFFPILSLCFFIIISALHFGEIDCAILPQKIRSKPVIFIYGIQIILFIILAHLDQTAKIISYLLPNIKHLSTFIHYGEQLFVFILITVFASLLLILVYHYFNRTLITVPVYFLVQTAILLLIIYFLPFYLGFAFYFGLWHSLLSFDVIKQKLQIKNSWSGWKQLIFKALPYSLIAWIGLIVIMYFGTQKYSLPEIISYLFTGIAILTLPHLQVFSKSLNQSPLN